MEDGALGGGKVGRTSGWSVEEDGEGDFRWSADGPTGSLHGRARTRAEAEAAARAAERRLIEEHEERERLMRSVDPRGGAEAT